LCTGEVIEGATKCRVLVLERSSFSAQLRLMRFLCVVKLALEALTSFLLPFHLIHKILNVPCKFLLPRSVCVDVLERLIVDFLEILKLRLKSRDFLLA